MTTVIEGTWEEIKSHDNELTGRIVRLIVEPEINFIGEFPVPANSVRDDTHLEASLLEGMDSGPMVLVTAQDWADVRREGRALAMQDHHRSDGHT